MYFRKYFEGTIPTNNSYSNIYIDGTSTAIKTYINQTNIINNAIVETLLAAGLVGTYGGAAEKCILRIAGFPVQFLAVSNVGNPYLYKRGDRGAVLTTGTGAGMFSGTSYKFYVSLLGDPKGMLAIYLGNFSSPAALVTGIILAKITDQRDKSQKIGVAVSGTAVGQVYICNAVGEPLPEVNAYLAFTNLTDNQVLTQNGGVIPLVEAVDTTGFFKIDHCYKGHTGLTANNFYNIGGDIFLQLGSYFLVNCTTEISQ